MLFYNRDDFSHNICGMIQDRVELENLLHKYLKSLDLLGYEITNARYKGKDYIELYLYGPWMENYEDCDIMEILVSRLEDMPDIELRHQVTGVWKLTSFYSAKKLMKLI